MTDPEISITIATYRRRDLLERVIHALETQTVASSVYEVIVCDSGSGDGTAELMRALMAQYSNLRYVDLATNTLAAKRNAGIREARAPLVSFLDDDAVPVPGFVAGHLTAHEGRNRQFVCGAVRFPKDWVGQSNYFRFRDSRHLGPGRPEVDLEDIPYRMIVVMNCSFRKEEISGLVGPVSEEFQRYGGEDFEFGYRVARAGLKIRFAADALTDHFEHGGSISKYMKKLYITSRDSLPVLYRLAPAVRSSTLARWLETPETDEAWRTRLSRSLIRAGLNETCVSLAERWLEATDQYGWLYYPPLFRYTFAGATLRGIRDRAQQQVLARPLASQAGGGGWFE